MELHPIRRRNGPNKDKNNIEDVMYVLHKCPTGLPTFVVSDLASLPPLDVNNVDFAHILGEIRALRAEMATLRTEVSSQHCRERSPSKTETQETQGGETTMPTRSDMHSPTDWMPERPILYTELPLQAGSSPAVTSEPGGAQPGGGRLSYATIVARLSMHSMHSSSSPMVAQFEGPVREAIRYSGGSGRPRLRIHGREKETHSYEAEGCDWDKVRHYTQSDRSMTVTRHLKLKFSVKTCLTFTVLINGLQESTSGDFSMSHNPKYGLSNRTHGYKLCLL